MLGLIILLVHYLFINFKQHSWCCYSSFLPTELFIEISQCVSAHHRFFLSCNPVISDTYYISYLWNSERYIFLIFFIYLSQISVEISSLQNVWGAAPWACCYADASITYVNMFQAPLDRRSIANANNKTNLNTDRSITLQGQNLWRFYQYISI